MRIRLMTSGLMQTGALPGVNRSWRTRHSMTMWRRLQRVEPVAFDYSGIIAIKTISLQKKSIKNEPGIALTE